MKRLNKNTARWMVALVYVMGSLMNPIDCNNGPGVSHAQCNTHSQ